MTDPRLPVPQPKPIDSDRLPELLELWLSSSRSGSPHTRRARERDLEAYGQHLGYEGERERVCLEAARALLLDPAGPVGAATNIGRWIANMTAAAYAPRTIARRIANLRSLCTLANQHGLPWRLAVKGPALGDPAGVEGPPPDRVVGVLRGLEKTGGATATRNRAIVATLYLAGLRRAALVALDLGDFDYQRPGLHVRRGKGGRPERRKIAGYVRDAIQAWLRYRGRHPGPLFHAVDRIGTKPSRLSPDSVYKLSRALGLGSPHGLRHTAATQLAKIGRLDLAQAHLGHASVATTNAYLDRTPEDTGEASRLLSAELEAQEEK